jgi:dimethylhistidine N-methyltransferase
MSISLHSASVKLYDLHPPLDDVRADVLQGLTQPQKTIPAKYLYDKRGAELFDQICQLDEYYLTRTEIQILQAHAAEIAELIGDRALVEFGSGSSQKIRILLDAMSLDSTYVALDISKQHLYESCCELVEQYPRLNAIAVCVDYTQPFQLPDAPSLSQLQKIGFFPGSTIGNLEPHETVAFLKNAAYILEPHGDLLIGVDLKKEASVLEPAYDDAAGVSAQFALNVLTRINRELKANFNLDQFTYRAVYNPIGRIEMSIVSQVDQTVQLDDVRIPFKAGETLRTEHSYKYTIDEFQDLATQAGFQAKQVWCDANQWFSLHYLRAA